MTIDYSISQLTPYLNWVYYYHAWQVSEPAEQQRLHDEAMLLLRQLEGRYRTHAIFELYDAYSDGDDIVVLCGEDEERIPCLRQQHGNPCLCLADFVSPLTSLLIPEQSSPTRSLSTLTSHLSPLTSKLGIFATSADIGLETDFDSDPYMKMTAQLLADRLAEATAEVMHLQVRKQYWGYAPDEQLTIAELHTEQFQGIRPAVGYPSLPDASINFIIDRLIGMGQIGIRLTESGAMKPHASVSGLMMAHPAARYFAVGKVGPDQLADYAQRRGLPVQVVRKFLGGNIV